MCVETNGIEPSTSCLRSTLTIVRGVVRSVDACSLVTARSSCSRCSAGAQTSGLRSFICARNDQSSLVRRRTPCRRWLRVWLRRICSVHCWAHRRSGRTDRRRIVRRLRANGRRVSHLPDLGTEWKATDDTENAFEGRDRVTGAVKWTGTRCDLIFGSNSQLRAIAEVYRAKDADDKFVNDFVKTLKQGHEPRPVQPVLGPPGANRGAGPICGSFQAPFCMRNA